MAGRNNAVPAVPGEVMRHAAPRAAGRIGQRIGPPPVTTAPLTRDVVARFVAGDTADDALAVTRRLLDDGLLVTLDYLGEDTVDPQQAAAVTDEYIRLLGRLAAAGMSGGGRAEVSVKPTAVGLDLAEHGEKTARENIARICAAARDAGTTVTLDAEDHTTDRADAAHPGAAPAGLPRSRLRDPVLPAPQPGRLPGAGGRRDPGSGCARAPTAPRRTSRSRPGPRWTGATSAACGCCWTGPATR